MIKVVLFDVDGMLVKKGKYKYFSERYANEYEVPLEKVSQFFKNDFGKCLVGEADIKETIAPYLKEWNWKGTVDEFLHYWFTSDCELDRKVLAVVGKLKEKGIFVAVATNNEIYRVKYLRKDLGFARMFSAIYASCAIGYKKPSPEFFAQIINAQHNPTLEKEEVLFWDSDEKNVEAARDFGIKAEHYTSFEDFDKNMKEYFSFLN